MVLGRVLLVVLGVARAIVPIEIASAAVEGAVDEATKT